MKHTKTFFKRALTVLLVLMTLMSTVSIGITSVAAAPEGYTETIELGSTPDEAAPQSEDATKEDSQGEADTQSAPQRPDKEIADVGANVDVAETSHNLASGTVIYFYRPSDWTANKTVNLIIGHSGYSNCYAFSHVAGNIYKLVAPQWDGYTNWAIINTDGTWSAENTDLSGRYTWAYDYSSVRTGAISNNTLYTESGTGTLTYTVAVGASHATGTTTLSAGVTGGTAKVAGTNTSGSATSNTTSGTGTVSISALNSTSVTLTASAKTGYTFKGWYTSATGGTQKSTNTSYTFTPTANTTLYAQYQQQSFKLTVSAGTGGSASGGGTYYYGKKVTVTATPSSGYYFSSWTNNSGNSVASTSSASTTVTITKATKVTANFAASTKTIKFAAGSNGTVSSTGGSVTYSSTKSSTATANSGYYFTGWTVSGGTAGTDFKYTSGSASSASITVQPLTNGGTVTFTANFAASTKTIKFAAGSNGTVSSTGGSVTYSSTKSSTATANSGYYFTGWTVSGGTAGTDFKYSSGSASSATIKIQPLTNGGTVTFTANFAASTKTIKFAAGSNGTVSSTGGSVTYSSTKSCTATANTGYYFSGWTVSGGTAGTDFKYSSGSASSATIKIQPLTNGGTVTFTANFTAVTKTIKFAAGTGGTVSSTGGSVTYSSTKASTATPSTGYNFTGWTVSGGTAGTDFKYTSGSASSSSITIQPLTNGGTVTFTANFELKKYTMTVGSNNTTAGTTATTATTVTHGDTVTFTPTAKDGYYFSGWDIAGSYTITAGGLNDSSITIKPTGNITATAYFYDNKPYIAGTFNEWAKQVMTKSSTNVYTCSYTLNPGTYTFKLVHRDTWYGNGGTIPDTTDVSGSSNPWETYTDSSDITLTATGGTYKFTYNISTHKLEVDYTPFSYTITASVGTSGAGTATVSKSPVNIGSTTTLTATENKGYTFKNWTITGAHTVTSGSTTSKSITIAPTANITAKANYTANSGTVSYAAGTGGSVSNSGDNAVTYPSEIKSTATASTGYTFSRWTISGGTSGTDYVINTGSTTSATIGIKVYTSGKKITATASFTANTSSIEFKTSTGGNVSNTGASNVTYPNTKASKATASEGYTFSKWTISGGTVNTDYKITSGSTTSASITIQPLTAGKTIVATASFTANTSTIKFVAGSNGTVTNNSSSGYSVTYPNTKASTATGNPGYHFTKWTISGGTLNTDYKITSGSTSSASITIQPLTSGKTITATASFAGNAGTVTFKAGTGGGVTNSGDNDVTYPSEIKSTATAAFGYDFSKWTISGGTLNTDYEISTGSTNSATIGIKVLTAGDTITVTANFVKEKYTMTVGSNNTTAGTTATTATTVTYGDSVTFTPTAKDGYYFSGWDIKGDYTITAGGLNDSSITIKPTSNITATAYFFDDKPYITGAFNEWTPQVMTKSSTNVYTCSYTLNPGTYTFKLIHRDNWYGNNGTIPDTTDYNGASNPWDTYTNTNDITLTATGGTYKFTYNISTHKLEVDYTPFEYDVTVSSGNSLAGSATTSASTVIISKTVTLKANTNKGYTFSGWTINGKYTTSGSTSDATLVIAPTSDITATANFTANKGTVAYTAGTGGSISGTGGNVTYPAESKSTATAAEGYSFKNWTISGGKEGTDYAISTGSATSATIGIKVYTSGKTITAKANFTANTSTVKVVAGTGGTVTNSGSHSVTYPATIASTATAAASHNFKNWTITGGTLNTDYKITAGSTTGTSITVQPLTGKTITVTANFDIKTYTVVFKNYDGTVLSTQTINHGSAATAPANPTKPSTAQYEYTFKAWDKAFSNITGDLTVTATFTETVRKYTVTFVDYDGDVLKTQTVSYGSGATAPTNPSRSDGWLFIGWDKDYTKITGALTVTAQYRDDNVYLVGPVTGTWDKNETSVMTYGDLSTMTLRLDEGTYKFQFIYNDVYLTNNGTVTNTTDHNGSSNPWDTWSEYGVDITLNAIGGTYTFRFNKENNKFEVKHTPITYTVTFKNYDGTVLKNQTVNRGEDATAPANPSRPATAQYTYTFSGWDKEFTGVRSNLTITAKYTSVVNKYKVTFKDYDGTVLSTQDVEYGSAATAPATPSRTGYTFTGWDVDFSNIKSALTVTAQYKINTYTVKFVNWDGSELKSQTVTHGGAATAPTTNPTRPATAQYTYTFKSWDKTFNNITADTTVTATYTQTVNYYTVTFVDYDNDVLKTQSVKYGSGATAPTAPKRSDGWVFIGWDKDFSNITGNLTVAAQYRDDNVYLVGPITGTWDKTSDTMMTYGDLSTKTLTLEAGTYKFQFIYNDVYLTNNGTVTNTTDQNGSSNSWETWSEYGVDITLNASGGIYTFYFNKANNRFEVEYIVNAHTVTFVNWDNKVITTAKVADGKTAAALAPTPTRPATAEYTYTFSGWDKDITTTKITADTTFKAQYSATKNKYTVTFVNWDNSVIDTQEVEYGSAATAPANPTKPGNAQYTYTFKSWDKDFSNITGATTVKATYTETVNKYTVTFLDYDGKTLDTQSVAYGSAAKAPTVPARTDGWEHFGWDNDFSNITGALTVTAQYYDNNIYLKGSFNSWGDENKLATYGDTVLTTRVELKPGTYEFKFCQNGTYYTDKNAGTITDTTGDYWWGTTTSGDVANTKLQATGGWYTFTFATDTKDFHIAYEPYMYTVTFKNWNGTVLKTEKVAIGTAATAPANPTKESTVQYDYTFSGWDKDFNKITGDTTVTALFTESLRKYTVTFVYIDSDGKTEKNEKQTVEYGKPAKEPTLPVRVDGYDLLNWDKDFTEIKGDITVTASYFDNNIYLVGDFNDWKTETPLKTYGNVVLSETVDLAAGKYEFKFLQNGTYYSDVNTGTFKDTTGNDWWKTTTEESTGNTTIITTGGYYTFTFATDTKDFHVSYEPYKYKVTFKDYNGTVLDTQYVAIGTGATAPANPTRNDGWEFLEWDKDFSNIQGPLTVTAKYFDNNVYLTGNFNKWVTTDMMTTSGENVVSLKVELKPGEYEFKFYQNKTYYTHVEAGVVNDSTNDKWLHTTTENIGNTKLNANGGWYTFTFAKDTKDFHIFYEAYTYTVTFKDYNQEILKTEEVAINTAATAPETPTRSGGWVFRCWDQDFSKVTSDLTVTAQYYDNNIYLKGDFNNWGTNHKLTTYGNKIISTTLELDTGTYDFKFFQNHLIDGELVEVLYTDVNAGTIYDSTGDDWWNTTTDLIGNTKLQAKGGWYTFSFDTETKAFHIAYKPNVFDVTFVYFAEDGVTEIRDTQLVDMGKAAKAPQVPVRKDGWVFSGWDKDFSDIQDYLVVNAEYIDDNVYIAGSFNEWNEKTHPTKLTDVDGITELTLEFKPGTYQFKLHKGDGWFGNSGTIPDTTDYNGQSNPWDMTAGSDVANCTLQATGGWYTFIYDENTQKLEVKYEPYMYDVTFVDWDGKVIKAEEVAISKDATAPAAPVRTDGWVFIGWDKEFTNVQGDLTVTALYRDDNVYLYHSATTEMTMFTPAGNSKPSATVRNLVAGEYEFKILYDGVWYTSADAVTDSVTDRDTVTQGDNCKLQASGGSYIYTFDKATKKFSVEHQPNIYHVSFTYYTDNGVTLKTEVIKVKAGENVTPPTAPGRTDSWFFIYWAEKVDKDSPADAKYTDVIEKVTRDMDLHAWYYDDNVYLVGPIIDGEWGRTEENKMTYNFEEGISTTKVHLDHGLYEFKLIYRVVDDFTAADQNQFYGNTGTILDYTTGEGWLMEKNADNCTLKASGGTYTFTFNRNTKHLIVDYVPDVFTVTFKDWDGTVLKTEQVNSSKAATAPKVDIRNDGWEFSGWDTDFSEVYSDLTVTAQYYDNNVYLMGDFNDWKATNIFGPYGENIVSTSVVLEAGSYEFKLLHNGTWYGNNGDIEDTTTKTSDTGWEMTTTEEDCTLIATGGRYVFNYNRTTGMLEVLWIADEFTVNFYNWNGELLKSEVVYDGDSATAPETPVKVGDAQYSYVFTGWDKDFTNVKSDLDVNAQFEQVVNKYKVTFNYIDADGKTSASYETMVEYGSDAIAPELPRRTDGWEFLSWDKEFSNITDELTVTANYFDGNVYLAGTFNKWHEKDMPMGLTDDPNVYQTTIELMGTNEFKLKVGDGWFSNTGVIPDTTDYEGKDNPWDMTATTDSDASNCTINATGGYYTFTYNKATQKLDVKYEPYIFTVRFVDYNDIILKTEEVEITKSATAPEVPSRTGGFEFLGWDSDLATDGFQEEYKDVRKDLVVYAQYYDNNLYIKGTFNNWGTNNMLTKYGDRYVSTTIELEPGTYTFKFFRDELGNEVYFTDKNAGTVYDSTGEYWWDATRDLSVRDTTLVATGGWYTFTFDNQTETFKIEYVPYEYTVKFVDWDGTLLKEEVVKIGNAATAPDAPTREPDDQYTYEFYGWDKPFSYIRSNLTVTAVYSKIVNKCTVTFVDHTGAIVGTQTVDYGTNVTPPTLPDRNDSWFFIYWAERMQNGEPGGNMYTHTVENVTRNMTLHAWYYDDNVYLAGDVLDGNWHRTEQNKMTYGDGKSTVTVHLEPGEYEFKLIYRVVDDWSDMTDVMYGNYGSIEDTTSKTSDSGWLMDAEAGNCTLIATGGTYTFTFDRNNKHLVVDYVPDVFTVTFVDWNDKVLKTEEVIISEDATAPADPSRGGGFTFTGWDKDFTNVHSDLVVKAQYADDNLYVLGDFNNWKTDNMLTTYGDNVVSVTVEIKPGTYGFKFFRNGTYYTDESAGTFTDTTGDNWWSSTTDNEVGNTTINATGGWYTFTFAHDTGDFSVTYEPYMYNVKFLDWNGNVLKDETVKIGSSVTAPADPSREADAQYTYTFTGWDKSFSDIQSDLIINAVYEKTLTQYNVTFVYYSADGTTQMTEKKKVSYGSSATAPMIPARTDGWVFTNWDSDFSYITSDMTVTANYIDDNVYLCGEFNGWNEKSHPFQLTDDPDIVTLTIDFERDPELLFKLKRGDGWFGNNGTIVDTTRKTSDIGWEMSTSAGNCTLDASGGTYTFIYNKETRMLEVIYESAYFYTVIFVDHDGTVLKEEKVEIGWNATPPADPSRAADAQYTYIFAGWDSDLTTEGLQSEYNNVKKDLTVTAIYTETINVYKVTFVDHDGTVLSTQDIVYGKSATAPADPVRQADAQYTYTFTRWDKSFENVVEDLTVTAQYSQTVNKYTVTFKDWNGTVLKTESVEYGSAATAPADPVRKDYKFTGWDKEFTNITEDTVLTATYADNRVYLKGDFNNWDPTTIMIATGNENEYSVRIKLDKGSYKFKVNQLSNWFGNDGTIVDTTTTSSETGWDMSTSAGDCTLDASGGYYTFIFNTETQKLIVLYESTEYTVVFLDDDGTLLSEQKVMHGEAAVAPANPTKAGYVFAGWDTDFSCIIADTIVTAVYAIEGEKFTVTFVNYDGSVISTVEVAAGQAATAPADPTREGDEQYSYIFAGWDKNFTMVSEDMIVTATYTQVVNKFKVTFVDFDDTVIKEEVVEYGKSATAPAEPVRDGYIFIGWDNNFTVITKETTVKAMYVSATSEVTVTFVDWDGRVLKEETIAIGGSATAPDAPFRQADAQFTYAFSGWDKEFTAVMTDITVTATYTTTLNKYLVRFYNYNGAFLHSEYVEYGKAAAGPQSLPERPGNAQVSYTFIGWDKDISYITGDISTTALFESNRIQYQVTFKSYDGTILKTQMVPYGGAATAPAMPVIPAGNTAGWDKEFSYITGNLTVNLVLTDNNVYIVGDMTGWEPEKMSVTNNGNIYSYKIDLAPGIHEFKFQYPKDTWFGNNGTVYDNSNGWWSTSGADGNITLQATGGSYEFQFNKQTKQMQVIYNAPKYTVTFVNYDGSVLSTQVVEKGMSATAPATPSKPSTEQYSYTFSGWDKSFEYVTTNLTVTALYTQSLNTYFVNFVDYDGSIISSQAVEYGSSAVAPADPSREHYTFTGWSRTDFTYVTGDMTVEAQYLGDTYNIIVNQTPHGTASTSADHVVYDGTVELTASPDSGYSLTSWILTGEYDIISGGFTSQTLVIRPKSDITATANFGQGVSLTVHSYSQSGYTYLYMRESNGTVTNEPLGAEPGTYQAKTTVFDVVTWRTSEEITMTNGYSAEVGAILNDTSSQSGDIYLQDVLYNDDSWAGVKEVWITEDGIVTTRRELLDLIENVTLTYNNGVNAENYTDRTWNDFVDAYKFAAEVSGSKEPDQGMVDQARADLKEAYDNLKKRSYNLIIVTQVGGIGTVTVGDTTITTVKGTTQASNGSDVTIVASAPAGYYISSIISNGNALFTNANTSITAKSATINNISADQDVEVHYEPKSSYTITVEPYNKNNGTIYYNNREVNSAGEVIVVYAGSTATFKAVANDGYAVYEWTVDDEKVSLVKEFTLTDINENHTVGISWQQIKEVDITIAAKPSSAGNATAASGGQTASTLTNTITIKTDQFDLVTLTATVTDPLFEFAGWSIQGDYTEYDSTTRMDKIFNITATEDITATAMFVQVYRKIYLENEAGWTQPYIYYWGSDRPSKEWPGEKMTYDPESGYWYGYIPVDATDLQFNDGTNQNQVEFSDVTPNLYNNGSKNTGTFAEQGYYLQGIWNGVEHSLKDLEKFDVLNADGSYSITITVTSTTDGYIYVNPTNELSKFWNAEYDGKTDNPQILEFINAETDNPKYVKVEIDPHNLDADYEVTFTFYPEATGEDKDKFMWTVKPLIPSITIIGTDGRGTNSSDANMVTPNNRVGDTYFEMDDVITATTHDVYESAQVIAGEPVTFYTQVNGNGFGGYDYYVYGWVINGTEFVPAINKGNGLYSGSYIFTANNTDVVPVYFHTKEWLAANRVQQVTVYAVADKNIENWDEYMSSYTWYNGTNGLDYEQFGAYPGQLMVPVAGLDGVYYTFVETTSPDGVKVSGIRFNNYAKSDMIDTIVVDYKNIQTYDYYDFVALLEDGRENITFVIKNTNDKCNASRLEGENSVNLGDYNFVQYTDYSNLKTDIFGNNIESIDSTLTNNNAVYIIQAGDTPSYNAPLNGSNYVKCFIYDAKGNFLGSCFSYELHDKDSKIWTEVLAKYQYQRAYFSYEAMNGNRYDGEWYGDGKIDVTINVSVNVAITANGGQSYSVNTTDPINKATYGAGFVNVSYQNVNVNRGTQITLTATPERGYQFVGWYTTDGVLFSTNKSVVVTAAVGTTYTAVFEEMQRGNFYVNHYIYTGVGDKSAYVPTAHGGKAQLYVGITNETLGIAVELAKTESAFVQARVGDVLTITIATDAIGADKFFAWYVDAYEKYGFTSFEEVGVDSLDNTYNNNGTVVGRSDMVYFRFTYVVKEGDSGSINLYSDLMPVSAEVTLVYQYNDRNGKLKNYYVPYTLTNDEIEGFAGNNFKPYTPAFITGEGWINTILANAPFISDLSKDTNWVINSAMYDTMTFVLWATQTDTMFTITTQVGDSVLVKQHPYSSLFEIDIRDIDNTLSQIGFWYNDVDNDGVYTKGIDLILTYGPHYAYRVTCDMNINYEETDKYDFNINIDEPAYGREQTSNEDGSNKKDKVTVDYMINILTPYFYGQGNDFVPSDNVTGNPHGQHVTVESLRNAGYTVNYGVILEQVGSFAPGSENYPTFEDALKAAQGKNYGVATDSEILAGIVENYEKPVMSSVGTYCTLYDASDYNITNKNRFRFTIGFNNTAANQKKFFNVYSYVTVTTPEGVTTTYISNVQTLNIYTTGTSDAVVNNNTIFA